MRIHSLKKNNRRTRGNLQAMCRIGMGMMKVEQMFKKLKYKKAG